MAVEDAEFLKVPPAVFSTEADHVGDDEETLAGVTARAGPTARALMAAAAAIVPRMVVLRTFFTPLR